MTCELENHQPIEPTKLTPDSADGASKKLSIIPNSFQFQPRKLSKHDYILVITFTSINVIIGAAYCVLSPFFPKEAERRGLTPTTYGILFAIQEVIAFILCPIYGVLLPKIGFRFTILTGCLIGSTGIASFGVLNWLENPKSFTAFCAVIRAYGSVGLAALTASIYAAIPVYYPNHISQLFGLMEMFYGLGMIVGPLLGGFLYEHLGFGAPFFVCGALLLITFPSLFIFFPKARIIPKNEKGAGVFKILSNYRIFLNIFITLIMCVVFGFNQSMIEPHIRSFSNLRSTKVGLIILLSGVCYGLFTWLAGLITPKFKDVTWMSVAGNILNIFAFLLMGPMYPIPLKSSIQLVIISQILYGIALALCLVSNFTQAMREKDMSDLKNDTGSGAIISTLFTSVYALGTAIGPILGGVLVEHFNFPKASIAMVALSVFLVVLVIATILFHKRPPTKNPDFFGKVYTDPVRY